MASHGAGLVTVKAVASIASPCQRLYRCLNVVKAVSFADEAAWNSSIIKNPKKGQERKMNDDIRRKYYPLLNKTDERWAVPDRAPFPVVAEDESLASDDFPENQLIQLNKVRQILIDSYKGAVSSEETFAEVKMESNENTSKSGFWGKDQIHDLLPRTTSKELQKDEKDAAKKTAHAIILNAATSASDAKTKVARILKLVGELHEDWIKKTDGLSALASEIRVSYHQLANDLTKEQAAMQDMRIKWQQAAESGQALWEFPELHGTGTATGKDKSGGQPLKGTFTSFEDAQLPNDLFCDFKFTQWASPPSIEDLKKQRTKMDEFASQARCQKQALWRMEMATRVATQTVDELFRIKTDYESLKSTITQGAGSLAALDHTLDNMISANANLNDIRKSWNQIHDLENLYLGQSWDWDQQLATSGNNKIALEYDIKPTLPDIFTNITLTENIGIKQTVIGAPIPTSASDEDKQRNALETFHLTQRQQEHDIKVKRDEWRDEVIRIQEERKNKAYEGFGWSWNNLNKALKNLFVKKPIVVPPTPTIACCPY